MKAGHCNASLKNVIFPSSAALQKQQRCAWTNTKPSSRWLSTIYLHRDLKCVTTNQAITLQPPVVIKAPNEGSSFDVAICIDSTQAHKARQELAQRHPTLLIEQYIAGKELAVGVIAPGSGKNGDNATDQALPPVHIVPATEFYDYHAKYHSNDTQYFVDPNQIDLPAQVLAHVQQLALDVHPRAGLPAHEPHRFYCGQKPSAVDFGNQYDPRVHRPFALAHGRHLRRPADARIGGSSSRISDGPAVIVSHQETLPSVCHGLLATRVRASRSGPARTR